jgi:3-oxoacyl-[acyl-carrier protein] reductase
VLITGGSSGIGRETVVLFARAGAAVAFVARSAQQLEETRGLAAEAAGQGARLLAICTDVAVPERAEDAVRQAVGAFGRLDILVANAGVGVHSGRRVGEVGPREWFSAFEVNVLGVYNFVQCVTSVRTLIHG